MEQTGSEVVTFCEYFIMDVSGQICKKFCIPCLYFIIHSVFETVRDKDFYIITSCMMGVRPAVFCCRRPSFFKQIMPQFRSCRNSDAQGTPELRHGLFFMSDSIYLTIVFAVSLPFFVFTLPLLSQPLYRSLLRKYRA